MMDLKEYRFELISKSRKVLMGFAALWIAFYHSGISFTAKDTGGLSHLFYILDYHVYLIKSHGQIGVDIFLFLSAVGLYFSLKKDDDVGNFYRKRLERILPAYLIVAVLWEIFHSESVAEFLCHVSGISFFTESYLEFWYIYLLLFLYLIYPFLFRCGERYGDLFHAACFVIVLLLNMGLKRFCPSLFSNIEIALRRIPIFLLGCLSAPRVYEKKKTGIWFVLIALALFLLSFSFIFREDSIRSMYYRYLCGIAAFSITILFSWMHPVLEKIRILDRFLSFFGTYSYEVYLLYEKIVEVFTKTGVLNDAYVVALLSLAVCSGLCVLLKKVSGHFVRG